MKTILVVEDEKDTARLIEFNLSQDGFKVVLAADGDAGLDKARKIRPDLVVLDVMLPKRDGFEVCRLLRSDPATSTLPIIMVTAKGKELDRVLGLELGADDYILKPFSPAELVARIKAVLRRSAAGNNAGNPGGQKIYSSGALNVDMTKHEVRLKGKAVELTATEFRLLAALVGSPSKLFGRQDLLNLVWGDDYVGVDRVVDVHIRHLREKLGKSVAIETVRGGGYRFVNQV